jgi:ABC-type Fe3+/spermidine/putrescine transport system ATPase subunit
MAGKSAASVEFRNVTKRYGSSVTAVDNVSFTIAPGQLVTLLGPSGCGKTTTLRMIAGLELPSSGTIFIGNKDVTLLSAADRDVSMVFQSYALFPHMTVLENVAYGPTVSGIKKPRAQEMALEKLEVVGLKGLDARLPSELSGGQQQRVAVARALVLEPNCAAASATTSANCNSGSTSPSPTSPTTRARHSPYPTTSSSCRMPASPSPVRRAISTKPPPVPLSLISSATPT